MSELERRYRRLVRIFYPAGYRDAEIVDTYLALSTPDRTWPSVADVTDLAGGGLRRHLHEAGAAGIGAGLRLAATLALITATTLAGGWVVLELNPWTWAWYGSTRRAMSVSPGVAVWAAWLLAAVVHAAAPRRWTRPALGLALVCTVAVVPLAAVADGARPPVFVLLAHVCLGVVALGVPGGLPMWVRLLPLIGAAAALPAVATLAYHSGGESGGYYGWPAGHVLPGAGTALLLVTLFVSVGPAARRDLRGAWALLVLLCPIGMLWLHPLAKEIAVGLYGGGPNADRTTLAAAAAVVAVTAAITVSAALTVRRRAAAA